MKKRLRFLFRTAVAFVTAGAVITVLGLLLGGAGELSKEVTELVHVIRISVSQTVERIPMLERVANINGFTFEVDVDREETVSVKINEEYETIQGDYSDLKLAEASEVESLDISIMHGKFSILPSANGYYGIESIGAEKFQCFVEDKTLYLNGFAKDLGTVAEDAEIILYVPEEAYYEKVLLFCSGREMNVEAGLSGKELNLSSICGDNVFQEVLCFEHALLAVGIGNLSVTGITTEQLKLEVSTAAVDIDKMQTESLEVNLGMGNLTVDGFTAGDVFLNCGMGNLEMVLEDEQGAYNYDISGSAESVQIGADTLAGMVMERWIDNGADKKITVSCSMGSVKIEFVR